MNYTLETDAIRNRLRKAVIGIREDGTMAVLIPTYDKRSIDLVTGAAYFDMPLSDVIFPTLIRPGDRCEFSYVRREHQWDRGTYRGMRFDQYMFQSDLSVGDGFGVYSLIRPLPAAETEAVEIGPKYAGDDSKDFWRRVNALPEPDHMAAYSVGVALQNMEGTALNFINRCERNAASSEITGEPEPNPLLTRLTAAEQELAAIRAELERSAK
jgi:hypothetical protein